VSHDLQEPLRKMSLFSGQLEYDDENILSERSKSIIHKITGYALRMRELINNVQNYLTLIEKPFKSKPVDLDMAFGEAMRRVPGCESNSIKIIKDRLPIVSGDYDLMVTLFCHLLDNSIKFRREGCDLEINVETDHIKRNIYIELDGKYKYEEYIRIAFSDNGIGFNNRYATTIFELFRKANNTHKGYGIGLSFCKKIIEFHHGLIEGKSSPGIKTTFTILLPMPKARNKNKGDIQ
jgi:signal transduction histidine kinase